MAASVAAHMGAAGGAPHHPAGGVVDALLRHYQIDGYAAGWEDARHAVHQLVLQLIQAREDQAADLIEDLVINVALDATIPAAQGYEDRLVARRRRIDAELATDAGIPMVTVGARGAEEA